MLSEHLITNLVFVQVAGYYRELQYIMDPHYTKGSTVQCTHLTAASQPATTPAASWPQRQQKEEEELEEALVFLLVVVDLKP
ncbi:hypothetical protein Pcinc_011565 [Petrolisthes cinctipes]|uniref:Uncharacterized protein n=1 Tax=Petrolisthes cinctipes TaxID=88211 RepID=A0AAE1G3D6_PETCI|nr:hypothetical protein Pcinc_011565 [Petrolisthes cinctipes]